jgi:hypothetical protein
MSNHPCRFESSIIFGWNDGSYSGAYLQVLPDGQIAKVDGFLRVQETMTREEAGALVAEIEAQPDWNNGHDGYWGRTPGAKFHLATYNPLDALDGPTRKRG